MVKANSYKKSIDARVIAEWLVVDKNIDHTKIHKSSVRTLTAILESTYLALPLFKEIS